MNITKITSSYRCKLIIQAYKKYLKKDCRVLDVGSGNGIITKLLMDRFSIKVIGSDVKNYLIYDIPFIEINGKELPFSNNEFDVVMLNDVLHHIPYHDQEKLISESARVAKRVLIFEAKPTILGKITDIILNKYHYGDLNVPLSFRNIENWQKLFKKLYLKSKVTELKKPFWYPFSHISSELQK